MTRPDCISNRNIQIIASYVRNRIGSHPSLFEGLPYPSDEYLCARDFFLNEDEWTSYSNFERIMRKARELVGEPDFFFNCGASSARLRSWGRFHYFVRVFATPDDGYHRLPFFNKNFNDTKEIEVVSPPAFDPGSGKIRTLLKIEPHADFDLHRDYIGDPYLRGILSSIPTIWRLPPALVRQPLCPYNPEILFNRDPEFTAYRLDIKIEGDVMTFKSPDNDDRLMAGKSVFLTPEVINGKEVFLGKYSESPLTPDGGPLHQKKAILITETLRMGEQVLFTEGEIFMAPYFILDVSYDRMSLFSRLSQVFRIRDTHRDSGEELVETIDQLRKSMTSRNQAYMELMAAKARLDETNRELENKVEERTLALKKAQEELIFLNRNLETKVEAQVIELEKHNQLRRYLSPKLAEKILSSEDTLWTEPQRKMMTVVFTDIRGFSSLTDSLEPEELFHLLSRYHSEMIRIVHDCDGTLNKIVGDGLLIFFGDPIPMDDHADRAVRMAVNMQRKAADLSEEWNRYGHRLGVGIGINSGFVTVGNVGSDAYSDYTVIGNQVNVASRLETTARGGEILISQRTYRMLKEGVEVEEMGDIDVKGIHTRIKTYRVEWQ